VLEHGRAVWGEFEGRRANEVGCGHLEFLFITFFSIGPNISKYS